MTAYAVEKMDAVMPELEELLLLQYPETGDANVPCEPNWELYRTLEQGGVGALIVARARGDAIGFAIVMVYKNPNSTNTNMANIPTWFIKPDHGIRALLERTLLRHAIAWAKERGALLVDIDTSYDHSAGRLLAGMGFAPVSIRYRMVMVR